MVVKENPVNTGRKLNVYTTLCAFNLCPVSTGNPDKKRTKMDQICPFRHFFDPYPPDSCPTPITTKIDPYVEHHAIYVNLSLRFCDDLFNCFRRCQICRKWPKFAFDTHKGILIGNLIFMKF